MNVQCLKLEDVEEFDRLQLRDYQERWHEKTVEDRKTFSRILLVAATGTGKTSYFAAEAAEEWKNNRRTLVLENRDKLVRQTAKRIAEETGLEVSIEMADEHASPFSAVVVASVQTLCRDARLLGFSDEHFGLVVADESHHALSKSWQKVLNYFHYGAGSLEAGWVAPPDGTYPVKAHVLGVTATPELGGRKTLWEFYHKLTDQYQYLTAVQEGWLVPPVTKNIPLKIDIRGLRPGRTPNGSDFNATELSERLVPVLEALAAQIVQQASDRKGIVFVPSIECARLLAAAINRLGLRGIFVSGECLDVDEKTAEFVAAGPGTFLTNACLYVEGADFPDVSCIVPARATKSVGFYKQQIGRGTRVLPGVVKGLETGLERRAAIARSAKPNLLILDPLWISDRIDLCDVYDLFTDKPEVKAAMKAAGPPTPESALKNERDYAAALEKEARKHARKAERTFDPLAWGLTIGDSAIANFVPQSAWELEPPTPVQIEYMQRNHIDPTRIKFKGLAHKIIGRFVARKQLNLATPNQLTFLKQMGFEEHTVAVLSKGEAGRMIQERVARWEGGR